MGGGGVSMFALNLAHAAGQVRSDESIGSGYGFDHAGEAFR